MHQADHSADPGFRVEALATRSGVPVRTIREYQTWRLLHPPSRRGRIGWYDDSHLERLRTIARLQRRGYSIAGIRDLFDAWTSGSELRDILGITGDSQLETLDEAPRVVSDTALAELLPDDADLATFTSALIDAGVVVRVADGLIARSPALLVLVGDALHAGLPLNNALRIASSIVDASTTVADDIAEVISDAITRGEAGTLEPLLRRGRALLAQAVASHVIDQVGRRLEEHAISDATIGEVVDHLRIGSLGGTVRVGRERS
jgi:DNA-binding transcriptional MerR regulator